MSDSAFPDMTVRALQPTDAEALYNLDYSFETDSIYTLRSSGKLLRSGDETEACQEGEQRSFTFELIETPVDPPFYKDYRSDEITLATVQKRVQKADGGYVALVNNEVAGGVLLHLEGWRSLTQIRDFIVGRQFRRYGIGSLLLKCAADWARNQSCWAMLLETSNIDYPTIQFYLHNGFEIWSINRHFYPPGPTENEAAIFLGKKLR